MKKLLITALALLLTGCLSVTPSDDATEDVEKEDVAEEIVEDVEEKVEEDGEEEISAEDTEHLIGCGGPDCDDEDVVEDTESEIGCGGPDCDDEDIIRFYYSRIADGALEEAYAMKSNPEVKYDTFFGWYKNVLSSEVTDIEEIDDHKYEFFVSLEESGGVESSYFVVMEVEDGLLDTISADEIIARGGTEVYVKAYPNGKDLYVRKNGKDILVEKTRISEDNPSISQYLFDYFLTSSGKYLTYEVRVWEANYVKVYDVENDEYIYHGFGVAYSGFTDDENYFYTCTPAGMLGDVMKIYNVPKFDLKRDLSPYTEIGKMMVHSCYEYNASNNSYRYSLTDDFQSEDIQTYYFDTDTVE